MVIEINQWWTFKILILLEPNMGNQGQPIMHIQSSETILYL